MLITERNYGIVKIGNIYFPEEDLLTVNIPDFHVITIHTYQNWGKIPGYEGKKSLTSIINLSDDIDHIWRKFSRQHKRHIHRSEKNGTQVKLSRDYEKFYNILKNFLSKKNYLDPVGLKILPLSFMKKYGVLFIAENNGEIIGGSLYLHDKDNVILINSACIEFVGNKNPARWIHDTNCYTQWEAIKSFKEQAITNYDLGGVNYHSLNFGGDITIRYEYRKFNSNFFKSLFQTWKFLWTNK